MNRSRLLAVILCLGFLVPKASAQSPQINVGGVVSNASFTAGEAIAPGEIVAIFGTSLTSGASLLASTIPLPTRLAGTSVLINGIPAPLIYVSPLQIVAQVPELIGIISATFQVTVLTANGTVSSPGVTVPIASSSPGIFALDRNGSGPGAILRNSDFSVICPQGRTDCAPNPAVRGEDVAIFMTGLGQVGGRWVCGPSFGADSATNTTPLIPVVTIGGVQAIVTYSGLASGFVGLYQVNIVVPAGAPVGDQVPVTVNMGGQSNTVTIAISDTPPITGRSVTPAVGSTVPSRFPIANLSLITTEGGRVSWYKGTQHELIAFDAIVAANQDTEVFVMNPDGSGRVCVTCSSQVPKGFTGSAKWHPDGNHLVLQAENSNSMHTLFNHMAWGINQDLWWVRKDGTGAEKIFSPPAGGGALHAHFNKDGTTLVFAERTPTGGLNPWAGWRIHIADFDPSKSGSTKLSNDRMITPNGSGFYETHGFTPDGKIIYTFTPGGLAYEDDSYMANLDGTGVVNLTNSRSTWDEFGKYSPSGRYLSFMSSRCNPSLQFPGSSSIQLITELYIQDTGTGPLLATNLNEIMRHNTVISDYDWDATGLRIVFQVATLDGTKQPQIWMLTLR